LGHPDYGSRLHQLIGQQNHHRTQALAELYIRESLAAETRIKEITHIFITPPKRNQRNQQNRLEFKIVVLAVDNDQPLTISFNLNLEN
jgi:phage gp46-like protein